jgi:plastocyanin
MKIIKTSRISPALFAVTCFLLLIILSLSACSSSAPAPAPSSTSTAAGPGGEVTVDLKAQNMAFDKSTITVPAGAKVTINFDNQDSGIPHNFALYTDSSAATVIFKGNIITGPANTTYSFTAPATPGNYFFRCDVHPTSMKGQFVVQ